MYYCCDDTDIDNRKTSFSHDCDPSFNDELWTSDTTSILRRNQSRILSSNQRADN